MCGVIGGGGSGAYWQANPRGKSVAKGRVPTFDDVQEFLDLKKKKEADEMVEIKRNVPVAEFGSMPSGEGKARGRLPAYELFAVSDAPEGKKAEWTKIAALWEGKNGCFTGNLNFPRTKIVLMPFKEKE